MRLPNFYAFCSLHRFYTAGWKTAEPVVFDGETRDRSKNNIGYYSYNVKEKILQHMRGGVSASER